MFLRGEKVYGNLVLFCHVNSKNLGIKEEGET